LAAAVPDVHVTATGLPEAFAAPSAKNPAHLSSICEKHRICGSCASDRTIGVQREPGAVHAYRMPHRANSSQNARRRR
jgi:hypothetical protein